MGDFLNNHPFLILCLFLSSIAVTAMATYSFVTTTNNRTSINEIKSSFCNGNVKSQADRIRNKKVCNELLDKLLKDPTLEQKERLRQLVLEGRNP